MSSYHGAFAHVHTVAKGFFAHAGNWVEIVSKELTEELVQEQRLIILKILILLVWQH